MLVVEVGLLLTKVAKILFFKTMAVANFNSGVVGDNNLLGCLLNVSHFRFGVVKKMYRLLFPLASSFALITINHNLYS